MTKITKENARFMIARIKSKDTRPEIIISEELIKKGLSFVRHHGVIGKPDFVFQIEKVAIFVDGDFWHGFTLEDKMARLPLKWIEKIRRNMLRDKETNRKLRRLGWKVLRLWEHEVRGKNACGLTKLTIFLRRNRLITVGVKAR